MILAGIDEAGYGPLLGPLVVGCCAFELEADPHQPLPCLWKQLRKVISRNRLRSGKKLHVNDSKLVYSPAIGLKELERSVLSIVTAQTEANPATRPCRHGQLAGPRPDCPKTLEELLQQVSPHILPELTQYNWYWPLADERFPLEQDIVSIRLMANALRTEMQQKQLRCAHLAAQIVPERRLNHLIQQTRNKASVNFSIAAIHLDHLLRTYADRGLVILCDRQGGRGYYGSLLRLMFDDWSMQIIHEIDGHCEYHLQRNGLTVRLIFCEKAEMQCMPVAIASMLSKYLREALMRRFNGFWKSHLPELQPTAGYYGDGARFLQDIQLKRHELNIRDDQLIRSR